MDQNKIKYKVIGASATIILIIIATSAIYARRVDIVDIKEKKEAARLERIKTDVTGALLRENEELLDQGKLKGAVYNYKNISQFDSSNISVIKQSVFNEIFLIKNSSDQINKKEEYRKLEEKLNNNEPTLVVKLGMQLAIAAAKQGKYQRAIQYLDSYKTFTENDSSKISDHDRNQILSDILDRQSYYYLFLGNTSKAKELNSKALSLSPKNSWAYYTKSLIIMEENPDNKKGALEEAKSAYNTFQEAYGKKYTQYSSISKKITEAYFLSRLGNAHYLSNNLDKAEKYLTEALAAMGNMPAPENYIFLARLYLAKSDYPKTQKYLIKWEGSGEKSPNGYFVKAKLNLALDDKKNAQLNLATALDLLNTLSPPDLIIMPRAKSLLKDNIINEINKIN